MDAFLFFLAITTLLFFIAFGIELVIGNRSIRFLRDVSLPMKFPSTKVSIIIPARNEEKSIEKALHSILSQDYEPLEIIVINDRSTDRTVTILDRMAHTHPKLHVIHITELPQGWLGKNHALYYGAQQANGEFLLFSDADIVMNPSTVSKAVSYMIENQRDHLTLLPEIGMPGTLLEMFVGTFTVFFFFFIKPWKVKDPKNSKFVGIGAFNLVRAEVYRSVGTHKAIAMRPDDDIKLGKLIKGSGYTQELLFGKGMIFVEWYSSLRDLINGLTKNMFAAVDYKVSVTIGISVLQILLNVWPFAGVFLTNGITQNINLTIILVLFGLWCDTARFSKIKLWQAIGIPIAILLFAYILWRSMLSAIFNKGINWRGTHYNLADLKANKVR